MTSKAVAALVESSPAAAIISALPTIFEGQRALIAADLLSFAEEANKAVEAAQRLVVTDQQSFDAATDVAKSIRTVMGKIAPARKEYTDPLESAKKRLIALFTVQADKMEAALDAIKRKMTTWKSAEEARLRAAEEAQRKAEKEEADRLAAAAKAMGDSAGAAQIQEEAAERAAAPFEIKVSGSGAFGAKTVDTKRPVGEVTELGSFLSWLLANEINNAEVHAILGSIQFGKLPLNALAKRALDLGVSIPGFKAEYSTNLNFR